MSDAAEPENGINYKPSPVAEEMMASNAVVRGLMGPLGSGKSVACAMELVRRACLQQPDKKGVRKTRFAVIRNTVRMLKDTTIKTVHDWLPPGLAGRWYATTNTFMLSFPLADGTRVESEWMFRPLESSEDVRNLLSLELTGAWVNEYREVNPDIFINLLGRIGRYPKQGDAPPTWVGVIMDTNPPAMGTFWHKLFESDEHDGNLAEYAKKFGREVKALFCQPSGMSEQAENKDHLPDGYYELLLASGRDEDWLNVHVHGEYGTRRDGLPVFPQFNITSHKSSTPLQASPHHPLSIGLDFGLTPAAVMFQQNAIGQWLVLSELVSQNMGIEEFAAKLKRYLRTRFPECNSYDLWCDPAGNQRNQVNATTPFEILRKEGFTPRAGPSDLDTRLGAVRRPLNRMVDGKPGMLINPECTTLLEGFMGGYKYTTNDKSGEPRDVPDKTFESHVHDALQHGLVVYEGPQLAGKAGRRWGSKNHSKPIKPKGWSPWKAG
jgi:hypothetical protein